MQEIGIRATGAASKTSAELQGNLKYKPDRVKAAKAQWGGLLFILPALAFTLLFDYYPTLSGVYHAFYEWDAVTIEKFIGWANFVEIVRDPVFWVSVKNMLFFLGWGLVLMLPTMAASIILFRVRNERAKYLYRILFCLPLITPGIVGQLLWKFIYNPQFGLLNQLLRGVGLGTLQQTWLGDPHLARWCLILMGFPWISTIGALIYLGGLNSISSDVWDAAELDGATGLIRALKIEVPLLMGQFKLNLVGAITGGITGYGLQLIMTNGGPGFSTLVPGLYMYQKAFGAANRYGYASAVGLMLFVIALGISLLSMRYIKSQE